MAHSLNDLSRWTSERDWPRVLCPICKKGTIGPDKLSAQLSNKSKKDYELARQQLGPQEELFGTFTGELSCNDRDCRHEFAALGDYCWGWDFDDFDGRRSPPMEAFYWVRVIRPPIELLHVPVRTPPGVKAEIDDASELILMNPSAAGSRLRRAVEELMNAKKVRKTDLNKKGKRFTLSLERRIELFSKKHAEEADVLRAVKWVGNEGTHGNELKVDQVLLCATVLEAALVSLYENRGAEFQKLVRNINAQRGVTRRKR